MTHPVKNSKPTVLVDGVEYDSINAACRALEERPPGIDYVPRNFISGLRFLFYAFKVKKVKLLNEESLPYWLSKLDETKNDLIENTGYYISLDDENNFILVKSDYYV